MPAATVATNKTSNVAPCDCVPATMSTRPAIAQTALNKLSTNISRGTRGLLDGPRNMGYESAIVAQSVPRMPHTKASSSGAELGLLVAAAIEATATETLPEKPICTNNECLNAWIR